MKTLRPLAVFLIGVSTALATSWEKTEKSFEQVVAESDHVVIGRVLSVTMRDKGGREVRDPKARTEPHSGNVISFRVSVRKADVLKTSAKDFPGVIDYSLWESLILDLGSMKELEGKSCIILLEKQNFQPHGVAPFDFMWPVEWRWRERVERIVAEQKKLNQAPPRHVGSRPPSDGSPASEAPSALGPRG